MSSTARRHSLSLSLSLSVCPGWPAARRPVIPAAAASVADDIIHQSCRPAGRTDGRATACCGGGGGGLSRVTRLFHGVDDDKSRRNTHLAFRPADLRRRRSTPAASRQHDDAAAAAAGNRQNRIVRASVSSYRTARKMS